MISVELIDMEEQQQPLPCFNQVFRPKEMTFRHDGQGDCTICTTDEKNKHCSKYYPVQIKIHRFEVKE